MRKKEKVGFTKFSVVFGPALASTVSFWPFQLDFEPLHANLETVH